MLRERGRSTVGGYNVLIVNRRLSQCRHPLLDQQHPVPCLPARPSELSRSSLYQLHVACFIQQSIPSQSTRHQWRITSVLVTMQMACWWHVSHALEWGVDLYTGLEFWTFFQPGSQGVNLYADHLVRGNIWYCQVLWLKTKSDWRPISLKHTSAG